MDLLNTPDVAVGHGHQGVDDAAPHPLFRVEPTVLQDRRVHHSTAG